MGRIEGLQFALLTTFSIEALVVYALTDEEGVETSDFLRGLCNIMWGNVTLLILIVGYEYIVKPIISRSATRSHASSSVTSPDHVLGGFQQSSSVVNAL